MGDSAGKYGVRSSLYPLVSLRKVEALLGWRRLDLDRVAASVERHYHPFMLAKRGGGERPIDNPSRALKSLQKRINRRILQTVELPDTLMGAAKGKSIRDNGRVHVGHHMVVTGDIEEFFPSVRPERVFDILVEVYGCSTRIASLLTRLTTYQRRLPQGAPTSSTLAGLAILPLHDALRGVVERKGCEGSVWCDDVAVSGGLEALEVMRWLPGETRRHGYRLSPSKTRMMPRGNGPQRITGTIVNARVSRGRRELERIRRNIIALGRAQDVDKGVLASLKGEISHTTHLNSVQGENLLRLARKCLPASF